jgi:radical SAM protein with 4Fe4S-binding SPASM domain
MANTVASMDFQRFWRISKDHMEICRQCEFRYVCTDCRAYLESDVSRGKPARCSYDPSTGRWAAAAASPG